MLTIELKPNLKLLQQIAKIERFSGSWDRISQSSAIASDELLIASLKRGAEAALLLDQSTPPGLNLTPTSLPRLVEKAKITDSYLDAQRLDLPEPREVTALVQAHLLDAEFDIDSVNYLYTLILNRDSATLAPDLNIPGMNVAGRGIDEDFGDYRTNSEYFLTPNNQRVFPTVPVFLVRQRLEDLLEWTVLELSLGVYHPLVISGMFQLLFLQIHPYRTANHRLAQVLTWRLLDQHGFGFVRHSHFSPILLERAAGYFNALRQAEKTAYDNWQTANTWLEFFCDTLIAASDKLGDESERSVDQSRLSVVQKRIIDVVKSYGVVTREKVVLETGINLSTVKYNLSILSQRGHLQREGGGRTTSYRAV